MKRFAPAVVVVACAMAIALMGWQVGAKPPLGDKPAAVPLPEGWSPGTRYLIVELRDRSLVAIEYPQLRVLAGKTYVVGAGVRLGDATAADMALEGLQQWLGMANVRRFGTAKDEEQLQKVRRAMDMHRIMERDRANAK